MTDQTADDRSLLARIRSHLPDNFKAEAEGKGIDWVVFGVVALLAVGFVLWGFLGTDSLATASTDALGALIGATGWAFVLTASLFVVFVLWLALGKFGSIPLGQDGEKPAFKTWSWISMMFAAGMGIGLMFYGVAEPLYHYVSPPPGTVDGQTPAAIQTAMATSLFHWTLHPWAMYAVVGLAMAYGTYRMGRRQLLSDIFTPLFGRRAVNGAGGKVINVLAIFATLFGSAASLGLGAIQIGGGLQANGVISAPSRRVYVVIIAILTVCFVASAVSGIERGIQWLSNTNMVLAILLALVVFVAGPTIFILNMIPSALGDYIRDLPDMSARTGATGDAETTAWLASWTIFYWAWWVSWTPFVGMFIARISRGRTIRQFVTGVLLVPSVVSLLWFAIFGGAAIGLQQQATAAGGTTSMVETVDGAPSVSFDGALYNLIDTLGMPAVLTTVAIVLVMVLVGIFFVTGADSASIIMGSISSYGVEEPRKPLIVFWGVLMGCVAAVMLVAGGDDPIGGAVRAAADHDHLGRAVHPGHGRHVRRPDQGPLPRPDHAAQAPQRVGRRAFRPGRGRPAPGRDVRHRDAADRHGGPGVGHPRGVRAGAHEGVRVGVDRVGDAGRSSVRWSWRCLVLRTVLAGASRSR